MLKKINEIYFNDFEINKPNSYEIYFKNNIDNLPIIYPTYKDSLIFNLLLNLNEIEFFNIYSKLNNIGLDLIEYLNLSLYNFTFKIDDDRIKFWIVYLYDNHKKINFILWLLQYKFKNNLITNLTISDIPILNSEEIIANLKFVNDSKKIEFLFNSNEKGISLL